MRRRIAHGLALLLAVASLGAGAASGPNSSEAAKTRKNQPKETGQNVAALKRGPRPYQVGTASWYGEDFDGKATASGEPYDMLDFTAAHLTLPLGS